MSDEEEEIEVDEALYETIPFSELNLVIEGLSPRINLAFYGEPGIGKSTLFSEHPLMQPCTIVGLAARQAEDIGGVPMPDLETQATMIFPMKWFRMYSLPVEYYRECQAIRPVDEGSTETHQCRKPVTQFIADDWQSGHLACTDETCPQFTNPIPLPKGSIVFDEYDKGAPEKQTAVNRIFSEREMEGFKLSPLVRIIVISNREEDDAGVFYEMTNITKNRLVHVGVVPDFDQWEHDYATPRGISALIIGYLKENPDEFMRFNPNERAFGFATPRSWDYAAEIIESVEQARMPEEIGRRLLIGAIGRGVGMKFWTYREFVNNCPPISELASGTQAFPPLSEVGKWIALVTRCVASAEVGLQRSQKDTRVLQEVCKVIAKIPDEAALYRGMLASWLRRRPLTRDLILDAQAMGTDEHLEKLGDDLADMERPQATPDGTSSGNVWGM